MRQAVSLHPIHSAWLLCAPDPGACSNTRKELGDNPSVWTPATSGSMGDLKGVPGSWFWLSLATTHMRIWGVNLWTDPSIYISNK